MANPNRPVIEEPAAAVPPGSVGRDNAAMATCAGGVDDSSASAAAANDLPFRHILEDITDVVALLGDDGIVSYVNPSCERVLGWPAQTWVGRRLAEFMPADDAARVLQRSPENPVQPADAQLHEVRLRHGNGSWLSVEMRIRPWPGMGATIVTLHDIGRHQSDEEQLRLLDLLLEQSNDALELIDPATGQLIYVNERSCRESGYSHEELLNMRVAEIDPAFDQARISDVAAQLDRGSAAVFESMHRRKDGSVFPVELNIRRITTDRPLLLVNIRDISARKQEQKALAECEVRFHMLVEQASDPLLVIGVDGTISYASPATLETTGYASAELLGSDVFAFIDPIEVAGLRANLAALINDPESVYHGLQRFRHKNGSWRTSETTGRNLLATAPINGIVINFRDITERLQAQAALAANLALLRTQQEASLDGILVVDGASRVVSRNGRFLDMWQVPDHLRGDIPDQGLLEHVAGQVVDRPGFLARVGELYAHPQEKGHEEILLKDGRTLDRYSTPILDAGNSYLGRIWFFRDITERKSVEIDLRRINRALRTLSAGNSILLHVNSEDELFAAICRAIVEIGCYRMAWVGRAEPDAGKSVRPMASAGDLTGYVQSADISWADSTRGQGPTGTCIRTGVSQVMRLPDARAQPWQEAVTRLGCAASVALPLRKDGHVYGALTIYSGYADAFDSNELELLSQMAGDLSFGMHVLQTRLDNECNLRRLAQTLEATVQAFASTIELRDPYTAGHQRRVAALCVAIARRLELSEDRIHGLHLAASIHDLGKIAVPAELLSKPGHLSPIELELVREHAKIGHEIMKCIEFPWPIADMIWQHHERCDGSGYPRGLKGEEILLEARIIAVADMVEAMASSRPYRVGLGLETALQQIQQERGRELDGLVVDACLTLFRDKLFDPEQWTEIAPSTAPPETDRGSPPVA